MWPEGVEVADFGTYYFALNYLIVGRLLLGLYKTRDPSYVAVPTQIFDDVNDIIRAENVHVPHTDIDASPNFFWFEHYLPGPIFKRLYPPMMSCFYSALRRLGVAGHSLTGKFEDMLDDKEINTWELVLNKSQHKSKRDWVMSFYDHATAWDGKPLWPTQMTDFTTYFKLDEWDDQLEHAIAFHLIGAHRLEVGSWSFPKQGLTLPFRVALNSFSAFDVRKHFGRYGVDLYFSEEGLPVLVETPSGELVARGDKRWQYWKFVWRSSLVTGVTLVDHLHLTHFRIGNTLSRAVRAALPPASPLRRFMSIFTFGTIFVNTQAAYQLVGPNHMLHRATPFKDFKSLGSVVPEMVEDMVDIPAMKAVCDDQAWERLSPKLKVLPFYADARLLLVKAMRPLIEFVTEVLEEEWCDAAGQYLPWSRKFRAAMLGMMEESHYKFRSVNLAQPNITCTQMKAALPARLTPTLFAVTGWHRHVGFVGDYYTDPGLATMSWKEGEPFGRPRQHMIMTVINVFTSSRQPLLKGDYTFLFKGMQPDLEDKFVSAWRQFQSDLKEVEEEIDRRNEARSIKNINMSPKIVESAVSK